MGLETETINGSSGDLTTQAREQAQGKWGAVALIIVGVIGLGGVAFGVIGLAVPSHLLPLMFKATGLGGSIGLTVGGSFLVILGLIGVIKIVKLKKEIEPQDSDDFSNADIHKSDYISSYISFPSSNNNAAVGYDQINQSSVSITERPSWKGFEIQNFNFAQAGEKVFDFSYQEVDKSWKQKLTQFSYIDKNFKEESFLDNDDDLEKAILNLYTKGYCLKQDVDMLGCLNAEKTFMVSQSRKTIYIRHEGNRAQIIRDLSDGINDDRVYKLLDGYYLITN